MDWEKIRNKYRINMEALRILDALEPIYGKWGGFPISFYIADYDEAIIKQVLSDFGYPNSTTKHCPTDSTHYCVCVHL